jgi:hypothetical protein
MDAACALAVLAREVCEKVDVFAFSHLLKMVPARRGMALRDAVVNSQHHGGTYLGEALQQLPDSADRLIVFTDEQSHDAVHWSHKWQDIYVCNVASYQKGVSYHKRVVHLDGFSEAIIQFIQETEKFRLTNSLD